jgi:hypothetical protein
VPESEARHSTERDAPSKERVLTAIVIGLVLLVALYAVMGKRPDRSRQKGAVNSPEAVSTTMSAVTGDEPLDILFARVGCPVCHTIPGITGALGKVGPTLVLGTTGPQRLADPSYRGTASTLREYVIESIITPGAYVVPGYPGGAMPRWYGQKLSAAALDKIAAYLEGVMDDSALAP